MNNLTAKTKIACGICGKHMTILGLGRHLKTHSIDNQTYYEQYLQPNPSESQCIVCGKQTRFIKFTIGFARFCGKSCQFKYNENAMLNTMKQRYGIKYAAQSQEMLNKIKQTNIQNKGVAWAFHTDVGKQHSRENSHTKNAGQKRLSSSRQTCLEKYGVDHIAKTVETRQQLSESTVFHNRDVIEKAHSKEANQKRKQTMLDRYGVESSLQLESASINKNSPEARRKAWKTGHANGNSSSIEDRFEAKLKGLGYVRDRDYIREYKSDTYPFNCDFYLVSQEIYVELNIHWTHGYHAYDPNNEQDLQQLRRWQEKNSPFYKKAIEVWTVKDPLKFKYAKDNRLNYVVLWNQTDIDNFFIKLGGDIVETIGI